VIQPSNDDLAEMKVVISVALNAALGDLREQFPVLAADKRAFSHVTSCVAALCVGQAARVAFEESGTVEANASLFMLLTEGIARGAGIGMQQLSAEEVESLVPPAGHKPSVN